MPAKTNQQCPTCGALSKVWLDDYGTVNWQGCLHVERVVEVEGTLQLEFKT
jgi:hypothetical protein